MGRIAANTLAMFTLCTASGIGGSRAEGKSSGVALDATAQAVKPGPAAVTDQAAADLRVARALIDRIYSGYATGQVDFGEIYTSELNAAMNHPGDEEGLGYDPLCQCQDPAGLRYTIQSLEPAPRGATARVRLQFAYEDMVFTLRLERRSTAWLIADIIEVDGLSFLNKNR